MNNAYKDFPSNHPNFRQNKMQTKLKNIIIGAIVGGIILATSLLLWQYNSPKMIYRNDAQRLNLYAQGL